MLISATYYYEQHVANSSLAGIRRCTDPGIACLRFLFARWTEQLLGLSVHGLSVVTRTLSQALLPLSSSSSSTDEVRHSTTRRRGGRMVSCNRSGISSGTRQLEAVCCCGSLPHYRQLKPLLQCAETGMTRGCASRAVPATERGTLPVPERS